MLRESLWEEVQTNVEVMVMYKMMPEAAGACIRNSQRVTMTVLYKFMVRCQLTRSLKEDCEMIYSFFIVKME